MDGFVVNDGSGSEGEDEDGQPRRKKKKRKEKNLKRLKRRDEVGFLLFQAYHCQSYDITL